MDPNAAYKTIEEVRREGLGSATQVDYYTSKAVVYWIRKENIMYMGCPVNTCKKKVNQMNKSYYRFVLSF